MGKVAQWKLGKRVVAASARQHLHQANAGLEKAGVLGCRTATIGARICQYGARTRSNNSRTRRCRLFASARRKLLRGTVFAEFRNRTRAATRMAIGKALRAI